MKKTGAEILWECLVREGVEVVFGYPGGANMPIYDAMLSYPVHHVLVRHEQGGAHMADGYARASGKVGMAMGNRDDGFGSRCVHHWAGRRAFDRWGCVSRSGCDRYYIADHEA